MPIKSTILSGVNRIGQALPRSLQRRIADFPGVLRLFERLSRSSFSELLTPEGHRLVVNPLFHAHLMASGEVGDYEKGIRRSISKLTAPGMVAYDVGANVGVFSFLLSSAVGEKGAVYAFEPEENNSVCFEESLRVNDCRNIVLDKRAVGRKAGSEKFDRRGGAFSGRLVGEEAAYQTTGNMRSVRVVSIDHLVENEGFRAPDILKIDVEGNEGMVLQGMRGVLAAKGPTIICEVHTHLGETSTQVTDLLTGHGYRISDVEEVLGEQALDLEPHEMSIGRHIIAIKDRDDGGGVADPAQNRLS